MTVRFPGLRYVSLVAVIALGVVALRPPPGTDPADKRERSGSEAGKSRAVGERKYVIRVAPNFYMPGRRMNPGDKPLSGMREVADEFEKRFPDTRVEMLDVPVGQREWLVTQLSAEQAPEILNVNVEDVWQDVQKGWYVPLDRYLEAPNEFVKAGEKGSRQWWDLFRYQEISRSKAAPDGKMYCITLDMIETGIFYNKDLFAKLGLRPPKDWAEFMRLQDKIRSAGVTPMLVHTVSLADWGVDLVFDQLYRDIRATLDLKKDPKRDVFYKGYLDWDEIAFLNSKGFFTQQDPRWAEMFRILKDWRRHMPKDLGAADYNREFVQGKGAMYWTSSLFVQRLMRDPQRKFEWGVFYLPPITRETSRYAGGYSQCIIGEAATQFVVTNSSYSDTGSAETSTKLKRCVQFLQFATTPENCDRVVNEMVALMPNVLGVPDRPELKPFIENLVERPYTTTKWLYTFDLRFSEVMNRMLYLYLMDGVPEQEFMDWMAKNVQAACATVVRRKNLDLTPHAAAWTEAAPLRAAMEDLPADAR